MSQSERDDSLSTKSWAGKRHEGPQGDFSSEIPASIGRHRVVRLLGEGGFGRVYLAYDDDLGRSVAIKVPRPERIERPSDVEAYLAEARTLARLDHAGIVPVYEVGRTEDGLCYVVSKYVEGTNLAEKLLQARLIHRDAAALVASIAESLHYAHSRQLVHRDIKPANILIDEAGRAFLADFGLALRDEDHGKGVGFVGTPAYMSPEQARGEGHRVDGRSDVFSLGIVLYELLAGRRPFPGADHREVMERIAKSEPRPPRQVDDSIPKELERICLKAMSRKMIDRYPTAGDMAEDLHCYLRPGSHPDPLSIRQVTSPNTPSARSVAGNLAHSPILDGPDPNRGAARIIPKGLRSFDVHDADFFLELLPGVRDRDGLPEVLRFWKNRIESQAPDKSFKVGLIYGPSGCGKSSLMKAGLLPRLSGHVSTVFVEASPNQTEDRLLRGLRGACPDLPKGLDLVDAVAAIRRGEVTHDRRKVLLILDQFEQWLFSNPDEASATLVDALRHCDGERVQAIVMVRDDFWLAASRFMKGLEIRLVEGENSNLVDLFDSRHATKVLTSFGQAYGSLPATSSEFTKEQRTFVDMAVESLSQDGKVVPVRLALFAEMVKATPWTPSTLKAFGGMQGVGVAFLEEAFGKKTSPPGHRIHKHAAEAVLGALLPAGGTDIKGDMKAEAYLKEVSGYGRNPSAFDDLMRILDNDLRMITPTEAPEDHKPADVPSPQSVRYYQLTHDYIAPSVREWLILKQRDTRRGRARLKMSELVSLWSMYRNDKHLPNISEWISLLFYTKWKNWNRVETRMMIRATKKSFMRLCILLAIAVGPFLTVSYFTDSIAIDSFILIDKSDDDTLKKSLREMAEIHRIHPWMNTLCLLRRNKARQADDIMSEIRCANVLASRDEKYSALLLESIQRLVSNLEGPDFPFVNDLDLCVATLQQADPTQFQTLWDLALDSKKPLALRYQAAVILSRTGVTEYRWLKLVDNLIDSQDFSSRVHKSFFETHLIHRKTRIFSKKLLDMLSSSDENVLPEDFECLVDLNSLDKRTFMKLMILGQFENMENASWSLADRFGHQFRMKNPGVDPSLTADSRRLELRKIADEVRSSLLSEQNSGRLNKAHNIENNYLFVIETINKYTPNN